MPPRGLVFKAIRDNEQRAGRLGHDANRRKIPATAISGFYASIAGAEQLFVIFSGKIVIRAAIGGLGALAGRFVGAAFVPMLTGFLTEYTERHLPGIGPIFIVTIPLAPRGLAGAVGASRRGNNEGNEKS